MRVGSIEAGSAAARGGLQVGDIIVALDGRCVSGADDLMRLLGASRIGRAVEVAVVRNAAPHRVTVIPAERQARVDARG